MGTVCDGSGRGDLGAVRNSFLAHIQQGLLW